LYQNSPILTARLLRQHLHTSALRRTGGPSIGIIVTYCGFPSAPPPTHPFNISQSYRKFSCPFTLPLLPLPLPLSFDLFLYCFVHFVTASFCPLKPLSKTITAHITFSHSALRPFTHLTINSCYFPVDY